MPVGELCAQAEWQDGPTFRLVVLFHRHLDVLERTLPRCVEALTAGTRQSFEVVLHCDGSPLDVARMVLDRQGAWGVDEVRLRSRDRHVASGDPSNNGHRRLLDCRCRYVIVIEDDVLLFRQEASFDPLTVLRELFEQQPDVPVVCALDDSADWVWALTDVGSRIAPGVRSVNRVATHMIAYDVERFLPAADRYGAFDLDVFVDRDDCSYNWEDLVSHVGTTGGRRIAWPEAWPLRAFHCDRKVAPGSMCNTQDPRVKIAVIDYLEAEFGQARPESRS
ncbi:MAG: glycosyltransferase family A protein [Pseudonocardia sp.]